MSARAFVEDAWQYGGVRVAVFPFSGPEHVRMIDFGTATAVTTMTADPSVRVEPSWLHLDEASARALYEALARHFGGHPETASLRKDYEAERARVDKLIDFVGHPTMVINGQPVAS